MTRRVSLHVVAMAGTTLEPLRCVALEGSIGDAVRCSIYDARPSPCREFEPSFENGERNVRCDQARLRHGLAALTPGDWVREPSRPIRPGRRRGGVVFHQSASSPYPFGTLGHEVGDMPCQCPTGNSAAE